MVRPSPVEKPWRIVVFCNANSRFLQPFCNWGKSRSLEPGRCFAVSFRSPNYGSESFMPKYVIEREIPNVGDLSQDQLHAISQKSCSVLNHLGPSIQWVESYVTDNKIYCIYIAPNEEMVRKHASEGGFPANKISQVRSVISPLTAE